MIGHNSPANDWDAALDAYEQSRGEGVSRLLRSGDPEVAFERREFLREQPWRIFSAQVEQRLSRVRTSRVLRWTTGFAGLGFIFSTAAALFVFNNATVVVQEPEVRTKGVGSIGVIEQPTSALRLYVDGEAVGAGAALKSGSEIQFEVDTVGYDHVFVYGVEADGALSPYYPDDTTGTSMLIGIGRGLMLPDSVQLDDAMGRECMVAVFSRTALTWETVRRIRDQLATARDDIRMEQVCFEKRR